MENQLSIAVCESKNSEKVSRFIDLTVEEISQYCSKRYAKQIIEAQENGSVWGVYFTPSGRIRATFI